MKLIEATVKSPGEPDRLVKFLVDERTGEIVSVWVKEVYEDNWREYR